jgi:pilus assembly protein CpaB
VSGFIQPGTRVDVLFTRTFSNGDAATTTILQNVKVIAYGRQLDPAAKLDPRDTAKPTVATLLVTQDQAQKLVLAEQRGRIQLVLRNGLDDEVNEIADPVASADLGIEEPRKPQPVIVRPVAPDPPARPSSSKNGKQLEPGERVIRIYRGDKMTEETLK